jgi:hypothetical protein
MFQKEFKKVRKDHKIMRAVLLIIGWLAAGYTLFYSVAMWEFDWNFWHFSPKLNLELVEAMLGILVADAAIWFLAKASSDKASRVVSLLVCVFLAGSAVWGLHHDEGATGFLSGHYEIPLWYRGGRTLLLCVPVVFWVWWTRRHLGQNRRSMNDSQPILSD